MRGGLLSPPQLLSKWMAWQAKGLPLLHPSDFSGGNRKSINQCSLAWGRETTVKCPHEPKAQSKWTYCDQYVSRRGETILSKKSQHNGSLQPACAEYSRAQSSTEAEFQKPFTAIRHHCTRRPLGIHVFSKAFQKKFDIHISNERQRTKLHVVHLFALSDSLMCTH